MMKLLIILLSLLSERYLVHSISHQRFNWFNEYFLRMKNLLPQNGLTTNPYLILALLIIPILLVCWLVLWLLGAWLFGFIGLLLNLVIFYYCLGPDNSFYPTSPVELVAGEDSLAEDYFVKVNQQLFAVILWYILAGPLAIILYRLLTLSQKQESTAFAATTLVSYFDWVSARLTVLLYLLVGNFQQGFSYYSAMFFTSPQNNQQLLAHGGILAAKLNENEPVSLPNAQTLVEHALVVFLVFIALFTLVAWL